MKNTKENSAKEQQPYIPAGNGEKSGEFTYKSKDTYSLKEGCTDLELRKILSNMEYEFVRKYTNIETGKKLNKAIRDNELSESDELMKESIISAIKKHSLRNEVTVYRGISITPQIYIKNYYLRYIRNETIEGSLICSTSRSIIRAIKASKSNIYSNISIVFEILLPKRYMALPIEDVALDSSEQEILISRPLYKIKSIINEQSNNHKYKRIVVKLEEKKL